MKNKAILLFLVLLIMPFVSSADVKTLDFNEANETFIILGERDAVRFDLYGDHKIMVREIKDGSVALTLFVEGSESPNYIGLDDTHSIKVDFQRDDVDDMLIELNFIKENTTSLRLERLSFGEYEPIVKEDNSLGWRNYYNKAKDYSFKLYNKAKQNYLVVLLIAFLLLVLLWLNRRWIRRKYRRIKLAFI